MREDTGDMGYTIEQLGEDVADALEDVDARPEGMTPAAALPGPKPVWVLGRLSWQLATGRPEGLSPASGRRALASLESNRMLRRRRPICASALELHFFRGKARCRFGSVAIWRMA